MTHTIETYRNTFPASQVTDSQLERLLPTHSVDPETGRLYPKGAYTSEPNVSGTTYMALTSAATLIAAGVTFSMGDEDSLLDGDGEIQGVEFLPPANTSERANREADFRGFQAVDRDVARWHNVAPVGSDDPIWWFGVEVTEDTTPRIEDCGLLDDDDRWGHERDEYLAYEDIRLRHEAVAVNLRDRDYGEQSLAALGRVRKCAGLIQHAKKLGMFYRKARKQGNSVAQRKAERTLLTMKRGVRSRYAASVKLVVTRGQRSRLPSGDWEWHLLYLSKAQVAEVIGAVDAALGKEMHCEVCGRPVHGSANEIAEVCSSGCARKSLDLWY